MPERCVALRGMPTAAAFGQQRGFSLLELLVALIVVVLVTTLVNLSVSSGGQDIRIKTLVYELADVASYALDEAQMNGLDYGLLLEEEAQAGETIYTFSWLEHRIDGWNEPLSGKEVFARRSMPPGVSLELELEDAPVVEFSLEDANKDIITPQVVLYASGETTAGAINVRDIASGDLLWRIEWDLLGRFDVLPRGEVDEYTEGDNKY
ncbi:MAG: prepilin-type N-terminal cleavage/methylation domain-containing protein [Halioglobus sp.]